MHFQATPIKKIELHMIRDEGPANQYVAAESKTHKAAIKT